MSVLLHQDHNHVLPKPKGHLIGFVKTELSCVHVIRALIEERFADSEITVLHADEGMHVLVRMIEDFTWGDTLEEFLHQSRLELGKGRFILIIDVADRDRALTAANTSARFGGYGFTYLGLHNDEILAL